ncbi:MAG: hypothetical protein ACRCTY_02480 [Candidatus Adiutrix sp.]
MVTLKLDYATKGLTEDDWAVFNHLTSIELSDKEMQAAQCPSLVDSQAINVLAAHWHPEWVPMAAIEKRVALAFPEVKNSLIIPTQHNRIMTFRGWAGVEADVFDHRYQSKVQLLIHFKADKLPRAHSLKAMMERTYDYRALQLLDILASLASGGQLAERVQKKIAPSISAPAVNLARFFALRLKHMIKEAKLIGTLREEMLKNRLLLDFMALRLDKNQQKILGQAKVYIEAVKKAVKAEMKPEQFYTPQELIEEARYLGAGVIIPHPPIFWPILVSGLDVDGWEVWNSSTPNHTLFLLEALALANKTNPKRRLLAFMGDDTHMSSKIRLKGEGSTREIGVQPPWSAPEVLAMLEKTGQSLAGTISEYQNRLLA